MPPLEHSPARVIETSPPPPPSARAAGRRVVEVAHLRKLYGSTVAADDVLRPRSSERQQRLPKGEERKEGFS